MQSSSHNKASDRKKGATTACLAGRVTKCGHIAQPRLNESHPNYNGCGRGAYKVVSQTNDVMYRIKRYPRTEMMVVHLE
jgi:hypothetical protein